MKKSVKSSTNFSSANKKPQTNTITYVERKSIICLYQVWKVNLSLNLLLSGQKCVQCLVETLFHLRPVLAEAGENF